jgi:hypothetical protein
VAGQREEHVIEIWGVNCEIDDVDTGLIEVAENPARWAGWPPSGFWCCWPSR